MSASLILFVTAVYFSSLLLEREILYRTGWGYVKSSWINLMDCKVSILPIAYSVRSRLSAGGGNEISGVLASEKNGP